MLILSHSVSNDGEEDEESRVHAKPALADIRIVLLCLNVLRLLGVEGYLIQHGHCLSLNHHSRTSALPLFLSFRLGLHCCSLWRSYSGHSPLQARLVRKHAVQHTWSWYRQDSRQNGLSD